ncbi:MAG: EamA family transporter [Rhodobacteraceae bacterium]|nr:EamA family transporter [Paracoccaceae bacterium]
MQKPGLFIWLLLLSLGVIWGGSFLAVSVGLESFGPITIAAIRVTIAAVIILIASYALGHGLPTFKTPKGRRTWLHCLGMALFSNAIPFVLLSWGQLNVSSGFAGITMAVVPLLVLPLSHYLIPGARMTRKKALGFGIGFIGVIILVGPARILQSGGSDVENMARIACITASLCYACGTIITRLTPPGHVLAFSAAALVLASIILIPLSLILEGIPTDITLKSAAGVAYLGILPTALATVMLVHIVKTAGPPFLSLVNYQVPIWAVLIGAVALNEAVQSQTVYALGLILLGLAISQFKFGRFQ